MRKLCSQNRYKSSSFKSIYPIFLSYPFNHGPWVYHNLGVLICQDVEHVFRGQKVGGSLVDRYTQYNLISQYWNIGWAGIRELIVGCFFFIVFSFFLLFLPVLLFSCFFFPLNFPFSLFWLILSLLGQHNYTYYDFLALLGSSWILRTHSHAEGTHPRLTCISLSCCVLLNSTNILLLKYTVYTTHYTISPNGITILLSQVVVTLKN